MSTPTARLGLELTEVVSRLELLAPARLAEKWDNVGLLVEPSPPKLVQVTGKTGHQHIANREHVPFVARCQPGKKQKQ